MKSKKLKIIFGILIVLALAYVFFQLTGLAIFGADVGVVREIEKINETDILVKLNIDFSGNENALGIQEQVLINDCSEVYDISDSGILKFDNTIEWLFVKESLGIDIEKLESKELSYKIHYEKCFSDLDNLEIEEPECGNLICEEGEDITCPEDCGGIGVSCQNYPGPDFCPGGMDQIIQNGVGENGCAIWECDEIEVMGME